MNGYTLILSAIGFILLLVMIYYIGRVIESTAFIKGEKNGDAPKENNTVGFVFILTGFIFMIASTWSIIEYSDMFLPESASVEGVWIDEMTNVTFFWTFLVFVMTQVALFVFAFAYRKNKKRKALFYAHNNKLEVIWTVVPSIVLTFLVVEAYIAWDKIMFQNDEDVTIEVTAKQFGWIIRYPGMDGKLGQKEFKYIDDANNELGIDFEDPASRDDLMITDTLVLPKGKKVKVNLKSRDVLHSFYLPHFRVKMDCVPGTPTVFRFTPSYTTKEYRAEVVENEEFDFELACTEMCGTSHYGMQKPVKVVSWEEYQAWIKKKTIENSTYYSIYANN